MRHRLAGFALAMLVAAFGVGGSAAFAAEPSRAERLNRLEADVRAAEDIQAIKKLQRAYGYYLDKGMWEDLAAFFTDDAVANYPAGVFVGHESIRKHLFLNVGNVKMGEVGLGDNRLYNHMNIQPVVHLDASGTTAKGRWRAFAMFGSLGGGATWAEGVYEIQYRKEGGVWKISKLDYYSGFGAPYSTGWAAPPAPTTNSSTPNASAPTARPRRPLAHPPDRERNTDCDGFAPACIAPFHYENPATPAGGNAWNTDALVTQVKGRGNDRKRLADLTQRANLLHDAQDLENLQRIYGYYLDRNQWDQLADLFAENATLEWAQQGVYIGKQHIRAFLNLFGPQGATDGVLNDHIQLQPIVDVAPDGMTARIRSREFAMLGKYRGSGTWSEGTYENTFVKQNGVWKFQSLHFYPTFITDYDKGWAKDAQPAPTASTQLPPDRPPTQTYEIYPKANVPPFHYRNPVTGEPPHYPDVGGPSKELAAASLMPTGNRPMLDKVKDIDAALAAAENTITRVKDYDELDNLTSAYGYYLDKNLWNNLADLFSRDGSIELAQRGVYKSQKRVREFLLTVFGRGQEGPVAGRLGNHVQMQPVIHVAADGKTAKIRVRMMQQLNFGRGASMGGSIYENEAVKEDGVWKLSVDHTYNTFTASYNGGWMRGVSGQMPGPSKDLPPDAPPTLVFQMFPVVYDIPFHYANPVTGSTQLPPINHVSELQIVAALHEIGPKIDGKRTGELYAPLQPKEPYQNVTLTRDVSYGPHERHVLDIFTAREKGSGKPVVVFIHGGGFAMGSKHAPGSPFYDNVGLWAASHGLVGVTINYRLAPQFQYPSGVEDLRRAVDWLHGHIKEYGGDPKKIVLWGHSAGAAHAADYLADAANKRKNAGVEGAILTSGFYDLGDTVSVWKAYYGEDVSRYKERSSIYGLVKSDVPLLVTDAELDPETFRPESDKLAQARAQAGKPVKRVHLADHSHLSELYAVNTSDVTLSGPVLEFINSLE